MTRIKRSLIALVAALLTLSCSGEEPIEPQLRPDSVPLGEESASDGAIRLSLEVWLTRTQDSEGEFSVLVLQTKVENIGRDPIRYQDGGCGCPTPPLTVEDREGSPCYGPRVLPLCPCTNATATLAPGAEFGRAEQFPVGTCYEGPSDAIVRFEYRVDSGEGDLPRSLEVRVPVGSG